MVRRNRAHVTACERGSGNQREQPASRRQTERLIEHQIGIGLILAPRGMRDQRNRAYAQHLHQRVDQKAGIARRADAGDRRVAQIRNKIQINQLAEHDHDHAGKDLRSHGGDMADDRALREIFHTSTSNRACAPTGSVA